MMFFNRTTHRRALRLSIVSLALVIVCVGIAGGETAASAKKKVTVPVPSQIVSPPTLDELKNTLITGIDTTPTKLVNGVFEGPPYVPGGASRQRIELLDSRPVTGDLNGDGTYETIVFLSEDNGGTGACLYMAVMGRAKDKIVTIATVRLGDRLGVRSIFIDKGRIFLDLLQYGAKDAACCPSELVTRTWSLIGTGLVERVSKKRPGTLTLATLSGSGWIFRGFDDSKQATPGSADTVLVFEKDRISGSAGCNRYLGYATATKIPGELTLKASKTTNSECEVKVMKDEERYLQALRQVVRFGFYLGDLTLSWKNEDGRLGIMRFAPRKAALAQ